jgi:hypothetical protein
MRTRKMLLEASDALYDCTSGARFRYVGALCWNSVPLRREGVFVSYCPSFTILRTSRTGALPRRQPRP